MAEAFTSQTFNSGNPVTPVFLNDRGEPAPIEPGSVVWATSDDTVLSAVLQADGVSALLGTVAAGGPARYTCSADADTGSGVRTITGVSEDVTVTQNPNSMASTIVFSLGTPVDNP